MSKPNRHHSIFFTLFIGIVFSVLVVGVAIAQTGGMDIRVYHLDSSGFPNISVRVAPLETGGKIISGLTGESFNIYEDNKKLAVQNVEEQYVGVQVAFVLDASGSFDLPATVGEGTRKDDAIKAMYELFRDGAGWLQTELLKDQMMLMVPKGQHDYLVLQDWTNLYNTIYNQAFSVELVKGDTPLFKMVSESLKRMRYLPDYQQRAKFLIVLSDGIDHMSPQQGSDVILRANNLGVTILSIKIGPPEAGEAKNLQRIAEETNGLYTIYTGPDSLAPLYDMVKSQTSQYVLTYTSRASESGAHTVQVGAISNETEFKSDPISYSVNIVPISLKILAPRTNGNGSESADLLNGKVFERVADRWDADVASLKPTSIPIKVLIDFPDLHSRGIQEVMYEVDGRIVATLPPKQVFSWDFSQLKPGEQEMTLRVIVKDSLGIESASAPAVITVKTRVPDRLKESVIQGSIPGGSGHTVQLLPNGAEAGPTVQPNANGDFKFEKLAAGTYYVRDNDRVIKKGRMVGPIEADGENITTIAFTKVSLLDILREIPQWYWFLLVLALIAVGLALYAIIKKPPVVQEAMTTIVGAVRDATEVFRPKRSKRSANAFLVPVIDDAGRLGSPKPLDSQSIYIGRDPARAQIVFADRSVSRLHARIVEESDNSFVLHDEGSSSGTYVNGEPVTVGAPHRLQPGDKIEFGRIQAIFQTQSADGDDLTEVFLSQA